MRKILVSLIFFIGAVLYAQDKAYVSVISNGIKIGNNNIERVFNFQQGKASTGRIINKVSGTVYNVNSGEFGLSIIFAGWGPAYSKNQNGEYPVVLTSNDCRFNGYNTSELENGGKRLELKYSFINDMASFTINVFYEVYPDNLFMRKRVEVCDSAAGIQFLDKIYLESLSFKEKDFSHGQYGQPVFNKDIFIGVEFPTVENHIEGNTVTTGYIVGKKIEKPFYVSHTSVLGVSASPVKLEQAFMDYVDGLKVKGTRQFLLYNTWYDLRFPWMVDNPDNIMNEKNVLKRIDSFKSYLSKYDISLNAFVIDMGWDKITAEWQIDSSNFPHGFDNIVSELNSIHSSLGLWASPFGGYEERDKRAKWAKEHGYETSGDYLCFAGTKYREAMQNAMAGYTKKYNVGYFKWDGLAIACNEINHNHLPGIYSHETLINNFVGMIDSVREINPDIFINITIGSWLSPWWLKYADCVWMQGADYGYADNVPCINDRDKAITFKDGILYDDFRKQNLLFPISSIMTHGIIKGSLNLLGGKNETLDSFSNEVMMYFGRGVMMWELYLTPDLMSENELNSIATTIKWAKANKDVLNKTKMILGDPLKEEAYGFIHITKEKGILLLRNPKVNQEEVKIKLSPELGGLDPSARYYVKIIYPYNMILPEPVHMNGDIKFNLDGYEILAAELIPEKSINKNLPAGVKYSFNNGLLSVYGTSGSNRKIESLNGQLLANVKFNGKPEKIDIKKCNSTVNDSSEYSSSCSVKIPSKYTNQRIAFLVEQTKDMPGGAVPSAEITVNGVKKEITVKHENGKWFWISAAIDSGLNTAVSKIKLNNKNDWKVSAWIFADEKLENKSIKDAQAADNEILPAGPYSPGIYKTIISLNRKD